MTLSAYSYPNETPRTKGPYTCAAALPWFTTRLRGNQMAIRIDRDWGYRLQGITARRVPEDKVGIGFAVYPPDDVPPAGTVSGNAVWEQVIVSGFEIGAQLGHPTEHKATSEITFVQCQFANCDTGVRLSSFDTLNMVFLNLQVGGCRVGLKCDTGGWANVTGGSASGNTEADFVVGAAQSFLLQGFRSENCNMLFQGVGSEIPTHITLTGCVAIQRPSPTDPAVRLNAGAVAQIRNCDFLGGDGLGDVNTSGIYFANNTGHGSLLLEGCGICSPVPVTVGSGDNPNPVRVTVRTCWRIDTSGNFVERFEDFDRLYNADGYTDVTP